MSLSSIDHADTPFTSHDGIMYLGGMDTSRKVAFLKEQEERVRNEGDISTTLYVLRGRYDDVMASLGKVELGLHDIDGTHTTIGGHNLFNRNVDGLKAMAETGVLNVAVTGRHLWQVEELIQNHPEGTGIHEWLTEQGFFKRTGLGTVEYFEGTTAIENSVLTVRKEIASTLAMLEQEHGIQFETTSLRNGKSELYPHAHKTMFSVDAHREGAKILESEIGLHRAIFATLHDTWHQIDPENRIATLGTSSNGTFEFTPDGLNKEGAVRRLLIDAHLQASQGIFLGDSGNDQVVFENINDLRKGVIVRPSTPRELIEHADVAALGIGNAKPILDAVTRARLAARKIVIQTS